MTDQRRIGRTENARKRQMTTSQREKNLGDLFGPPIELLEPEVKTLDVFEDTKRRPLTSTKVRCDPNE